MISAARLAWLQLVRQWGRLAVALAGVAFAVLLMAMQLGFRDALYASSLNVLGRLDGDLVLIDPRYTFIGGAGTVPRARLFQTLAFPGVASVSPLWLGPVQWRNPETGHTRAIFAVGVDPARGGFTVTDLDTSWTRIRVPDVAFFDARGRPEYGPVADLVRRNGRLVTEVSRHEIVVEGLFDMGTSFGIDGTVLTSDFTFLRLDPQRQAGAPSLGLVRLAPGANAEAVRGALAANLPRDVEVLTRGALMEREVAFWVATTPIGYVFTFGAVMGVVVGAIIVYQILFSDISDHLAEYATLKAMGFSGGYLAGVVLVEALVLAVLGFVPGAAAAAWLSRFTAAATGLPMRLDPERALLVLGLTTAMCWTSSLIAMRKLRRADPAEVF